MKYIFGIVLVLAVASASAQELEVVGGCLSEHSMANFTSEDERYFTTAMIASVPRVETRSCEKLKVMDQWLTYTSITLTTFSSLTWILADVELKSLVAASGLVNPVIAVVGVVGGGVAYLVFKVSLENCKKMDERILNEKIERALRNGSNLVPVRSNIPVQIEE